MPRIPNQLTSRRWWTVDVVWAIGAGLAVGAVLGTLVGRLVIYLRQEHREALGLDDFLALGLITLSYGIALGIHSYGFLAVFAAGLAVRRIERRHTGQAEPPVSVEAAAESEEAAGPLFTRRPVRASLGPSGRPLVYSGSVPPARTPVTRSILIAALAAGLLAGPARGQGMAGPAPDSGRAGLTYVLGIGYESGGPGPEVTESFDGAGFGDNRPRRTGITVEYPFHFTDGLNLAAFAGVRYRFDAPYSMELIFSNGHRGHAEGFNGEDLTEISVSWASFLFTATLGVHLGPVRLAAGPTLNAMSWSAQSDEQDLGDPTTTVLGATALAGVEVPAGDVVVSLAAGTRQFPTVDLVEAAFIPVTAHYRTVFFAVTVAPRP